MSSYFQNEQNIQQDKRYKSEAIIINIKRCMSHNLMLSWSGSMAELKHEIRLRYSARDWPSMLHFHSFSVNGYLTHRSGDALITLQCKCHTSSVAH